MTNLADTQRAIIEAAERRGYKRGIADVQSAQIKCLVDIRFAVGDNGKRMQDELVEYIRAIVAERDALRAKFSVEHTAEDE